MKIQNWPAAERPRERLLAQGAAALSDAELLALFIGQGLPGQNAVELARSWLANHQDLAGLLALDKKSFCHLNGAGSARYVLLQAALELGRRVISQPLLRGNALSNPEQVQQFLQLQIARSPREHFGVLFFSFFTIISLTFW